MPPPTAAAVLRLLHAISHLSHWTGVRADCSELHCNVHTPWLQHPEGGFGGGPYQLAHLAPTYAAVSALVTLGGPDALSGNVFLALLALYVGGLGVSHLLVVEGVAAAVAWGLLGSANHFLPAAATGCCSGGQAQAARLPAAHVRAAGAGRRHDDARGWVGGWAGDWGLAPPVCRVLQPCQICPARRPPAFPQPRPNSMLFPGPALALPAGGEVDVRGCYCALAACEMLGLDKGAVAAACGMPDFIRRCQVTLVWHAVGCCLCLLRFTCCMVMPARQSTFYI